MGAGQVSLAVQDTSSGRVTGCVIATAGSHSFPASVTCRTSALLLLCPAVGLGWFVFMEVHIDTEWVSDKPKA